MDVSNIPDAKVGYNKNPPPRDKVRNKNMIRPNDAVAELDYQNTRATQAMDKTHLELIKFCDDTSKLSFEHHSHDQNKIETWTKSDESHLLEFPGGVDWMVMKKNTRFNADQPNTVQDLPTEKYLVHKPTGFTHPFALINLDEGLPPSLQTDTFYEALAVVMGFQKVNEPEAKTEMDRFTHPGSQVSTCQFQLLHARRVTVFLNLFSQLTNFIILYFQTDGLNMFRNALKGDLDPNSWFSMPGEVGRYSAYQCFCQKIFMQSEHFKTRLCKVIWFMMPTEKIMAQWQKWRRENCGQPVGIFFLNVLPPLKEGGRKREVSLNKVPSMVHMSEFFTISDFDENITFGCIIVPQWWDLLADAYTRLGSNLYHGMHDALVASQQNMLQGILLDYKTGNRILPWLNEPYYMPMSSTDHLHYDPCETFDDKNKIINSVNVKIRAQTEINYVSPTPPAIEVPPEASP